jgi:hypothetical protein
VRVLSVFETGVKDGYGKVSLVSVTEAVRGAGRGDVFELEHSAVNVACPNVSYEIGEDALIFAVKSPNGRYATLYAATGSSRPATASSRTSGRSLKTSRTARRSCGSGASWRSYGACPGRAAN